MQYYDHAMVGATIAVAVGAQRRFGWPVVFLAGLAGAFPDWDALFQHVSSDSYQEAHRSWGHNLFAVTLAGIALGAIGFLIHQSTRKQSSTRARPTGWMVTGAAIMWTHPILDVLYCGPGRYAEWPVQLLWPLTTAKFARPWIPWTDWGATFILAVGFLAIVAARRSRQGIAALALGLLVIYVAVRGMKAQL